MPHHVIIDGSNLATEGRTLPSLKQLNEAIAAYRSDHPDDLITVVVDATFGHRIDPKEVPEFEKAIDTNAFVAPPAGAVGRGDGFVLSIAQKVKATVLSNDSYQEFHGEYPWLFDEGRLIGGKPVPHVGWVFVPRTPVRGPVSRRSVKEQKVVEKSPGRRRGRSADTGSRGADGPMPIPKAPPPGPVTMPVKVSDARAGEGRSSESRDHRANGVAPQPSSKAVDGRATNPKSTNDLLAFLSFVEHFPVGTAVTAVVESYSSHGAYVSIGDVKGYVPLRLMGDPAPRSAREAMEIGETVTLVVASFAGARRSIDLAVPSMAPALPPPSEAKARKADAKRAVVAELAAPADGAAEATKPPTKKKAASKKTAAKKSNASASASAAVDGETVAVTVQPEPAPVQPVAKKGRGKKAEATVKAPQGAVRKAASRKAPARSTAADAPVIVMPPESLAAEPAKAAPRRRAPKKASG